MADKLGITDKTDINSVEESKVFENLSSEESKYFEENIGTTMSEVKKFGLIFKKIKFLQVK